MRARWALLLVVVMGCGPKAGMVYRIDREKVIYIDEGLFRTAVQLRAVRSKVVAVDIGRCRLLGEGDVVRVMEVVPGGIKLVVEESAAIRSSRELRAPRGQVGWILEHNLPR